MGLSDAKPTLVVPALDTAAAQSATTRIAHRTHVSAASVSGTPDALDELRVAGPSLLPSPPATRQTRQQWAQSFHTSAKSDLPTIPSSRQTVLRGAASVSGTCDALGQHLVEKSMHPVKSAPAMMGSSSSAASTPSNDPRPVIFSPTPVTDRPSLRGFGSSPISHAASSLVSPQPSSRYSRRTTEGSAASPAVSSTPFRSARALLALGSMVPPL